MFKAIAAMLKKGDTLVLTIAPHTESDKLHVTVTPTLKCDEADREIINKPISIEATLDEFEAEFPDYLKRHSATVAGLRSTFEGINAQLKEAEKTKHTKLADKRNASAPVAPTEPLEPALF